MRLLAALCLACLVSEVWLYHELKRQRAEVDALLAEAHANMAHAKRTLLAAHQTVGMCIDALPPKPRALIALDANGVPVECLVPGKLIAGRSP